MPSPTLPRISLVIPSLNQGAFLEEALLSVIGQRYPDLEILVMDGGSQDGSLQVIQKYSDQISYWTSEADEGQAHAINKGFRQCSGEILCWLNSDDMLLPGTLLTIGRRLAGNSRARRLVYGAALMMRQDADLRGWDQTAEPFDPERLRYADYIAQPSSFWTRALWDAAGELDIRYRYALDWEWYIRASQHAHFEYVPRFFSVYRWHASHKTSTGGEARRQEIVEIVRRYAPAYWGQLYEMIHQRLPWIQKVRSWLLASRIPGAWRLVRFSVPRVWLRLKAKDDLQIVLSMLNETLG